MKYAFFLVVCLTSTIFVFSQSAEDLVGKLKAKILSVKDYEADAKLKTDVAFLKLPISNVKVYFKQPDLFRIKKQAGISVLPKGGIRISMNSLVSATNVTSFAAGRVNWKGQDLAILKLVPNDEKSDVVLTTLYVDEKSLLIRKSITTTKENGTYEMEMDYGKYAKWGLPDKAVMIFNTKDYKLPKGITFEYDAGTKKNIDKRNFNKNGRVEIQYAYYQINKGIPASVFTGE